MISELYDIVSLVDKDRTIFAVILTGAGRVFSVGADIAAFAGRGPVDTCRDRVRGGHVPIGRLAGLRVLTIGGLAVSSCPLRGGISL
ncbi:hypothetical protein G3256_14605 [Roseobacter ponti]|uniref:Enoyl-CoA hydratase n=2 Tax=Roseobacter ponti TaxID=1891787 RepID=A0A858SWD8_9RHOB|nr:hypothetical protein G3256_14605 [Roseobacter ponti]